MNSIQQLLVSRLIVSVQGSVLDAETVVPERKSAALGILIGWFGLFWDIDRDRLALIRSQRVAEC